MNKFVIDFDTLMVESKSEDIDLLHQYVDNNDLSMVVCIIDSADELALQFTLKEIEGICNNINPEDPREYTDITPEKCWLTLNISQGNFPEFTKVLGKQLIKSGSTPDTNNLNQTTSTAKPKTVTTEKSKGVKAKDLVGMNFIKGTKEPRKGTSFEIFTNFLEENLGEATFDELVKAFIGSYVPKNPNKPVDEALGRAYVRDAFNGGYIEEGL